jgi:hypothetical protein
LEFFRSANVASIAISALFTTAKLVLRFIDGEIVRRGGGSVSIHNDRFAVVGSITVVLPDLSRRK